MKTLTTLELCYIAAFTDGEGTIGLGSTVKGETPYTAQYHLDNTYLPVLTWMRDATDLGSIIPKVRTSSKWADAWTWWLKRDEIEEFLPHIMPYLRIKLPQAELLLEFLRLERGWYKFTGVPEDLSIQRKLIWEELRNLNKRGPS